MSRLNFWLLMFMAIAFVAVPAFANEDSEDMEEFEEEDIQSEEVFEEFEDEEEEWDGVTLSPSEMISTTVLFPGHEDKAFPVDEPVTVLIGVTNNGLEAYNISFVGAHLHSPFDLNYYIQNFSVTEVAEPLFPSTQATLEYKLVLDPRLEPLDYHFSAFVIINGTRRIYKQLPINGTVTLLPGANSWISDVITYIFSMAVIFGIGYAIVLNLPRGKKQKKAAVEVKEEDVADSWTTTEVKSSKKARKQKRA